MGAAPMDAASRPGRCKALIPMCASIAALWLLADGLRQLKA